MANPSAMGTVAWEETLLVDEDLERLIAVDALLLFEVRPFVCV